MRNIRIDVYLIFERVRARQRDIERQQLLQQLRAPRQGLRSRLVRWRMAPVGRRQPCGQHYTPVVCNETTTI